MTRGVRLLEIRGVARREESRRRGQTPAAASVGRGREGVSVKRKVTRRRGTDKLVSLAVWKSHVAGRRHDKVKEETRRE